MPFWIEWKKMYSIEYSKLAVKGLLKLRKSEPAAYQKAVQLISELQERPFTDTGKPEQLKGTQNALHGLVA